MMIALRFTSLLAMIALLLPGQVEPIASGEPAEEGEFPHQALLGYHGSDPGTYDFSCGGSLINNRYVLTAAHCVSYKIPDIVRLGVNSLTDDGDRRVDVGIERIIKHPDFTMRYTYNDIALLKLKKEVSTNQFIQPACIWTSPQHNFTSVVATGFGRTESQGSLSDTLQKVDLELFDTNKCEEKYASSRKFPRGILDSQLCIGSSSSAKDTCNGDAGGPVQVSTGSSQQCRYYIVGITSVGVSCGFSPSESIYTSVGHYSEWIQATVKA